MNNPLPQPQTSFKYLDIPAAFFICLLVLSNIASSAKIVDMGFSLFSVPLVFDGGTILFPLVYVLGDVITEVYGFKIAKRIIWTGFAIMAFTALVFLFLEKLPGENFWQQAGGSNSYNFILGGMSHGGIVLASLAAYLAGELVNAFILSKIKIKTKDHPVLGMLWIRTIGSTLAGEFLDTFIFVFIAVITGVFAPEIFWSLVITNYILKCGIEILVTPLTYWSCSFLKKREGLN